VLTVQSLGVELAAEVIGSGEPVTVVGHGLTQDRRVFAVPAQFMPGTKVLFDFRGHGESGRPPPGSYSFDHFAADVRTVADEYKATRVVGISLGAGATLRLLESDPDRFERLVFILPARLERSDVAHKRLLRLAEVLETYPPDEAADIIVTEEQELGAFDTIPSMRESRRDALIRMHTDSIPYAIRELLDEPAVKRPEVIRSVQTPALVIGQEGDNVHKADVARELAAALPNAELEILSSPSAWMDDLPRLVQRVAAFLAAEPT
jgi:3-oxoadipate enol-lactonase